MSGYVPEEFVMLKGQIVDGMVETMESAGDDADYAVEAVDTCATILEDYLNEVFSAAVYAKSKKIMDVVKFTINELNELNDDCNQCLIESSQRDQILDLINSSAALAGLEMDKPDITEEWRGW